MTDELRFKVRLRKDEDEDYYVAHLLNIDSKPLKLISNSESEMIVINECVKFAQELDVAVSVEGSDKRVHHWEKGAQHDELSLFTRLYGKKKQSKRKRS